MRLGICIAALLFAAAASAQSTAPAPSPAPERASSGLNLKLDDRARRSILVEPPAEKAGNTGAALPALGGGAARSFDPPTGSRPKSAGGGVFPKSVDTP